ncbi:MAG: division/cell wall cluster transcriptional repressor MraZ [Prevotellaceae bacterium]|jgi:MraZ protein|nr:division/cell wall cluster transcriptional repressor MraZ [Prevotellaceae bacterium]
MSSFFGKIEARLDAKGRVFVPAAFRRLLGVGEHLSVVLRKDFYEDCLVIYPKTSWEALLADVRSKLNPYKREHNALLRNLVAEAEELELDSQGRMLLQKRFLQHIGSESDVIFVGEIDKITLWAKTKHEKNALSSVDFAEQLGGVMNA